MKSLDFDEPVKKERISMGSSNWTEKYRPQTLSQVVGHNKAVEELKNWAQAWTQGTPEARAVVLYGRAGIGKTTAAHALAHDMGWEVIEMNASDQRTAEIIEKVAGSASQMSTLTEARKRLVIMDEADNIHGTADRGGERAVLELIKKTSQPIVLIANELYDMSSGLRSACKPIQFSSVMSRSMIPALKRIVEAEGIKCGLGVLEKIAENANGDLRSAINDLQAAAQGKSMLELADIITGERDSKESIFKVLVKVFKGGNIIEAHNATFNLDENPEDFIQWVDENLPLELIREIIRWTDENLYEVPRSVIAATNVMIKWIDENLTLVYKEALEENPEDFIQLLKDFDKGYRCLSRASIFLGRVSRRQNYNMWRYASVMMTGGIIVTRSHRYSGYVSYQPPSLWKKLGQTRGLRQVRDSACAKIGAHCHVSMSFTRSQLLPFFRMMLKDEEYAPYVAAILALEPEEIGFLTESKSVTKTVQKIYDEAQALIEAEVEHEVELFGGFGTRSKKSEAGEEEPEVKAEKEEKKEVKSQSSLFDF